MDRWEDADDDVQSCKQKGKVARLGIAGFVRAAVAGEQEQQQQQSIVIVESKRAQRAAADRATMPPPVTAVLPAAAAPAQPAIPRPAVPSGCFAPPAGVLLLVHKSGELLQQLPVTQVMTVFGRLPQNDVVLDHASISRQHAALCFQAKQPQHGLQAVVMDLGSAHGTFVQGSRLAKGQLHPLQPGESIQFGASTRAYKLFLPAPQQDAAAIKKRARVMFADSVEDEVGHDGGSSSSTSQTFKQKRKLEEVIGYSDGKHFTKVGPQAVSGDGGEQGQFAHLLQASQITFHPAKPQQQQPPQGEHSQGQAAGLAQQQELSAEHSHKQQSGKYNTSHGMQPHTADARQQQTSSQQQVSAAAVQQPPDAEADNRTVLKQQELRETEDHSAGPAAAVAAQSTAVPAVKQFTLDSSAMHAPANLKSQGSLTKRWSAGAAALLPPQLRKAVATGSSELRPSHQQLSQPEHEAAAGGRSGSSSLYEELPAAKPVE